MRVKSLDPHNVLYIENICHHFDVRPADRFHILQEGRDSFTYHTWDFSAAMIMTVITVINLSLLQLYPAIILYLFWGEAHVDPDKRFSFQRVT